MAKLNRTGTYIAFAAEGGKNITETDFRFYNLMKAWDSMKDREFNFVNSHEKVRQIRDGSSEPTIMRTLKERLKASKRFLLLVGDKTKDDDDYVPAEIEYAINECDLPIILCYVNHKTKLLKDNFPDNLERLIPPYLKKIIDEGKVTTIHIPFREKIISYALDNYDLNKKPEFHFSVFKEWVYDKLYEDGDI